MLRRAVPEDELAAMDGEGFDVVTEELPKAILVAPRDGTTNSCRRRHVASPTWSLTSMDVETIDLRVYAGTDSVTVNGLATTDVTEVRTDLAAVGGGDDAAIDSIVVPHGLTVGQDAQGATVDGLGAKVRVLNGSATDRIHVSGTTGADVVTLAGTPGADTVSVVADGTDVAVFGATAPMHLRLTTVAVLDVDLGAGADSFSVAGNVAALVSLDVDGGDGDDTLLASLPSPPASTSAPLPPESGHVAGDGKTVGAGAEVHIEHRHRREPEVHGRRRPEYGHVGPVGHHAHGVSTGCLVYTSDAADDKAV